MSNMTASRFGSVNGAGATDALFLKVFAGEVLTTFLTATKFLERHQVRTIQSGKSAQFPVSGLGTAEYHTPGTEILGDSVNFAEQVITIDDLLIAPRFIASIDEAKSQFDVRQIYTSEMGFALANTFDKQVAQVALLAARAASPLTGGNGGSKLISATSRTDVNALISALESARTTLDQKNIPESDRFAFVTPAQYSLLSGSGSPAINRDYNQDAANGGIGSGTVLRVAGLELVKTNNMPAALVNSGPTAYQGDFTNTSALVMHKSAVGTVKLLDLALESEYLIKYQGTLMVAKYAMGHGVLRPEAAVEIAVA